VEFYSKHKFEELVHLVGFVVRIKIITRSNNKDNIEELKGQK